MSPPSLAQVQGLAPDASSLQAGKRLATPAPWSEVGHDDVAAWGRCKGSGRVPYEVAVDSRGPAYRCSCPSRKLPCKHAIGLMLMWADGGPVFTAAAPPAEVSGWLAARAARVGVGVGAGSRTGARISQRGGRRRGDPGGGGAPTIVVAETSPGALPAAGDLAPAAFPAAEPPADPVAAAARVAARSKRIAAGMAQLELWLGDLVREGFGHAEGQPYGYFDEMAALLVDAQAPGAASRVRALAGVIRSGPGWPGRLLGQVARLHLLASGWGRIDDLPVPVRADLRAAAGWPWSAVEILAGERETDHWYVLARSVTEDERVRARRTWLWGLTSGRLGVVVDYARPGAAFGWELWPGNVLHADVARYPGSAPLRVVIAAQRAEPAPAAAPPGWESLEAMAAARSQVLVADPWLEWWPVSVKAVTPVVVGGGANGTRARARHWALSSAACGRSVGLSADEMTAWKLVAVCGGREATVLGEWAGEAVVPLGVWVDDRMVVL